MIIMYKILKRLTKYRNHCSRSFRCQLITIFLYLAPLLYHISYFWYYNPKSEFTNVLNLLFAIGFHLTLNHTIHAFKICSKFDTMFSRTNDHHPFLI
jgi:hypothetical protein